MGRAIDMEKDIYTIKQRLSKIDRVLNGVCSTLDELEQAVFETEDERNIEDGKKETNNEGNGKSSSKSNKRKTDTTTKTSKS
tara:strand:+ start:227 stop:472 length:246 start_codon:yes stop_codon:yes gene_type:complete